MRTQIFPPKFLLLDETLIVDYSGVSYCVLYKMNTILL